MRFINRFGTIEALLFIKVSAVTVFKWMEDCKDKQPIYMKNGDPAIVFTSNGIKSVATIGTWVVRESPGVYSVYQDDLIKHFFIPVLSEEKEHNNQLANWNINLEFKCWCGLKLKSTALNERVTCPNCKRIYDFSTTINIERKP